MSKSMKIWLIIAASLVLLGCVIFGGVMTIQKWAFTKLSTNKYETNNYEINEKYKNISIVTDTTDIVFIASENTKCYVECYERGNAKHSVEVKDGTLVIKEVNSRKWYEHIGINLGSPKISVYIPQGEYGALSIRSSTGDVKIPKDFKFSSIDISGSTGDVTSYASASGKVKMTASTGHINVQGISANELELSVSTGKITASDITCEGNVTAKVSTGKTYLTNITCKNVISNGNTGDIYLKNVIATQQFSIKRSTGDVNLALSDAPEIFVETDTGDVSGALLSEKIFITKTSTGDIDVPKTLRGGKCEITTSTGDIIITVKQ